MSSRNLMSTPAQHFRIRGIAITVALLLGGCTPIESVRVDHSQSADGLTYFLPMRDIAVTVTQPEAGKGAPTVAVQATDAMPDPHHAFVARIPHGVIATNKATLQVNSQGLLNSDSTAQVTSSLTAILQGIATTAGVVGFAAPAGPPPGAPPCPQGIYTRILHFTSDGNVWQAPAKVSDFCGFDLEVSAPTPDSANSMPAATKAEPKPGAATSGLFYRLSMPYIVKVTPTGATGPTREFLVFSPSGSQTYFLPVATAAFASNDATLSFDNGVPTKYGQTIQSEVVGLVGLPATLVQSYFKAIGDVFGARQGSTAAEKNYLDALNALALERSKRDACRSAVSANDPGKIASDCK